MNSKYKVTLALGGRLAGEVSLMVEADSYDSASKLGDALAQLMPAERHRSESDTCDVVTYWSAYVEDNDE